jgi:hypothetical protein
MYMGPKYKYTEIHPPESLRRYSKKEKKKYIHEKLTQIRKKEKKKNIREKADADKQEK